MTPYLAREEEARAYFERLRVILTNIISKYEKI